MKINTKEIEEFQRHAKSEYLKMQQQEDKNKRRWYHSWIVIMICLPFIIVGVRVFENYNHYTKNDERYALEKEEVSIFASSLLNDETFLKSLKFQNGVAKVYLEDLYTQKKLTKPYYDINYTHQCLGYFLITYENARYHIYTNDYCSMS